VALVLFDASDIRDPLHGVGFWLKQFQTGQSQCPIILVAAQTDRGTCPLPQEELTAYCQKHGITGPMHTSASTGDGVQELIEQMKAMIPWEDKPTTVTTTTFKRIKDYVLGLKGEERVLLKPELLNNLASSFVLEARRNPKGLGMRLPPGRRTRR
jgi:hypothetical protein